MPKLNIVHLMAQEKPEVGRNVVIVYAPERYYPRVDGARTYGDKEKILFDLDGEYHETQEHIYAWIYEEDLIALFGI